MSLYTKFMIFGFLLNAIGWYFTGFNTYAFGTGVIGMCLALELVDVFMGDRV